MDKACYDNIIGLSKEGCLDCLPAPTETASLSGLFLDQLESLGQIDDIKVCKDLTIWNMMADAREQGVIRFMGDANGMLASRYRRVRESWSGFLGRTTPVDTYLKGAGNYAGIRINPLDIAGGMMRIKSINTLFRESGTVSVKIYDSLNRLKLTKNCTISAGYSENALSPPLMLPLYDPLLGSRLEYFVVYESTKQASLNEAYCTCGGFNVNFDTTNHYGGMQARPMENRWSEWAMVGGWTGTNLTGFNTVETTAPSYAYGLILDVDFFCNASEVLCKENIKFDGSNVLAFSIAYAILYAAADYLAARIMTSTKLSRAAMVNREALTESRSEWQAKYIEHISYVVDHLDISANDCLACESDFKTSVSKNLI